MVAKLESKLDRIESVYNPSIAYWWVELESKLDRIESSSLRAGVDLLDPLESKLDRIERWLGLTVSPFSFR